MSGVMAIFKIMSMLLWNGDETWITIWKSAMELCYSALCYSATPDAVLSKPYQDDTPSSQAMQTSDPLHFCSTNCIQKTALGNYVISNSVVNRPSKWYTRLNPQFLKEKKGQ